jgi:hypothetical protein
MDGTQLRIEHRVLRMDDLIDLSKTGLQLFDPVRQAV